MAGTDTKLYTVWTRTGGRRHVARSGSAYTLCGREHMGFTSPTSGARSPRYHIGQIGTCLICAEEAQRHDHRKDR